LERMIGRRRIGGGRCRGQVRGIKAEKTTGRPLTRGPG
jgi:hypothetical protein